MRATYFLPAVLLPQAYASLNILQARQLGDIASSIPPECQGACAPIVQKFNECPVSEDAATIAECACTPDVFTGISTCFECLAGLVEASGSPEAAEEIRQQGETISAGLQTSCDNASSPSGSASGSVSASSISSASSGSASSSSSATVTRSQSTVSRPPTVTGSTSSRHSGTETSAHASSTASDTPESDAGSGSSTRLSIGGFLTFIAGGLFLL